MTIERRFSMAVVFPLVAAGLLASGGLPATQDNSAREDSSLAYHDHAPTGRLPSTLEASRFEDNPAAFVAYSLASRMKKILYQVPCYCPCKRMGHQSLLDCYRDTHGVKCRTCQKETIFCYLEHQRGKPPSEIRNALARGETSQLNFESEVEKLYSQLRRDPN
jgi:uncharacterized protein with PCYCGC motif